MYTNSSQQYAFNEKRESNTVGFTHMSVPRSMARIMTVDRGSGIPTMMKSKNGEISGMFEVSVYLVVGIMCIGVVLVGDNVIEWQGKKINKYFVVVVSAAKTK